MLKLMYKVAGKRLFKIVGSVATVLLIGLLLIAFWPARNEALAPQEVVSAPDTTLPSLMPSEEFFFQQPPFTSSNDAKPVVIVSRITGLATSIPDTTHWGGSIYEGSFGPVISRSGNYLAYVNPKDRAVVVMDTHGNRRYLPSNSIVGKETDVNTGIHEFSPSETKLMFTVSQSPIGCWEEGPEPGCIEPKGVPSDIRMGYHVADLTSGQVTFLAGVATSSNAHYFQGWIDDNTLLFEQQNILFEYDLRNSRLVQSLKFRDPGEKEIHHFSFVGIGIKNTQVYMYGTEVYSGSPKRLVARRGLSETILAESDWGDIQPRDAHLSEDGRYVIWKVKGEKEEHRFDLETL